MCVGLVAGPVSVPALDFVAARDPAGPAVSEVPSVCSCLETGQHCMSPVNVTSLPFPYPFSMSQGVFLFKKIENVK